MLVLPISLTHREAPDAVRLLAQTLRSGLSVKAEGSAQPVAVDASALQQFDSSALAVLLECRRMASAVGRSIELRHPPAKLRQLARLYGLADLLGVGATTPAQPASM